MSVVEGLGWPVSPPSSPEPVGWHEDVSRETKDKTVKDEAVWGRTVWDRTVWDRDASE